MESNTIHWMLSKLFDYYGPQGWWPGNSQFEIMVGAILTQNTAWNNVAKAIARLDMADCLAPDRMLATTDIYLAELIRPAGYFNVKARRLHNLCRFIQDCDGLAALKRWETLQLRQALLTVNGIGPETADDILLYAFNRPVFVVDAYTRRIGSRLELFAVDIGYEAIRNIFEEALGPHTEKFNELHALLVQHAKQFCRTRPQCDGCCLKSACKWTPLAR